jgi:hypothetical protein
MRRLTVVALAVVLLLLAGAVALAFVDFDVPALRQEALSAAGEATGAELEIDRLGLETTEVSEAAGAFSVEGGGPEEAARTPMTLAGESGAPRREM